MVEGPCLCVERVAPEQVVRRVVAQGDKSLISALMVVMDGVRPGLRRGVIVCVLALEVAACLTLATMGNAMMTN